MGKKNRNACNPLNYWESADYNSKALAKNLGLLISLAINRFRWTGLPDTCDARFLEVQLHKTGMATICHPETMPDVWQSLIASPFGPFDVYGYPLKWRATGYGNATNYAVSKETGDICYYSYSRTNPWNTLNIFALKLTHYERTEDLNLMHQHKPFIFLAEQSQKLQLENLMKQVAGGEYAVLGDKGLGKLVDSITKIDTEVPLITEDLARSKLNVLNDALMFLGIPHLAFEKGERMIEDEAQANTAPTNVMLLDCLQARRDFCKKMQRFGLDLNVYFNDDLESYNFNYLNNAEAIAQDGLLGGVENDTAGGYSTEG